MPNNSLEKLFEHNNWANEQLIRTCSTLSEEQLDAEPHSATKGSIRSTLRHLVASQRGYLSLLTMLVEERVSAPLEFYDFQESARISGEGLLALARDESGKGLKDRVQTMDGYYVEPWVVMVQVINHATEHREQIKSMLSALGVTPPEVDGWSYGEYQNAVLPNLS